MDRISNSALQEEWKHRDVKVIGEPDRRPEDFPDLYANWSQPDGVVVSGNQGSILRVTALFTSFARSRHDESWPFQLAEHIDGVVVCVYSLYSGREGRGT